MPLQPLASFVNWQLLATDLNLKLLKKQVADCFILLRLLDLHFRSRLSEHNRLGPEGNNNLLGESGSRIPFSATISPIQLFDFKACNHFKHVFMEMCGASGGNAWIFELNSFFHTSSGLCYWADRAAAMLWGVSEPHCLDFVLLPSSGNKHSGEA